MNIEQMAIDAGVIVVDREYTCWTENNAIEVLDKFARLVIINNNAKFQKLSDMTKRDVLNLFETWNGDLVELDKWLRVLTKARNLSMSEMLMVSALVIDIESELPK
jgi:hypothetical protein